MREPGGAIRRIRWVGMGAILLLAFWLRLAFLLHSGLYVDEYITMLAARAVRQFGYPRLPSGQFYNHGLPFVYLDAGLSAAFGPGKAVARFPALLFGLMAVALVYQMGRRWFSAPAGQYAAAILATTSTAVIWGGRARMYTLQQLCFLLALFGLIEGFRRDRRGWRVTGLLAAVAAILCHPLTLVFLLGFALSVVLVAALVYGFRRADLPESFETHRAKSAAKVRRNANQSLGLWNFREGKAHARSLWPEAIVVLVACGVLLAVRFIQGPWSVSGRTQTDPGTLLSAEYLIAHLLGGFHAFIVFPDLVLTTLFVTSSFFLVLRLVRRQIETASDVVLALVWLTFLAGMSGVVLFLVFKADRYVLALTPLYCLVVGHELEFVGQRLIGAVRWNWGRHAVVGLAWALLACLMVPPAVRAATSDPIVLDCAWAYVKDRWAQGDAVATGMPVVADGWFGQVDHFAMETGHKTFETEEGRVDIWTGAPLLDTPALMLEALARHRRLWFVMDERGWDWFYSDAFKSVVETNMRPVSGCPRMRVYVSED